VDEAEANTRVLGRVLPESYGLSIDYPHVDVVLHQISDDLVRSQWLGWNPVLSRRPWMGQMRGAASSTGAGRRVGDESRRTCTGLGGAPNGRL
jgi:hypothetical protein